MDPLLEIKGREIKLCQVALGQARFIDPEESEAAAQLCKLFTDAIKNPEKYHAYNSPRKMGWLP